jgi:hypothetical protein
VKIIRRYSPKIRKNYTAGFILLSDGEKANKIKKPSTVLRVKALLFYIVVFVVRCGFGLLRAIDGLLGARLSFNSPLLSFMN